jgi:hypothetical protein
MPSQVNRNDASSMHTEEPDSELGTTYELHTMPQLSRQALPPSYSASIASKNTLELDPSRSDPQAPDQIQKPLHGLNSIRVPPSTAPSVKKQEQYDRLGNLYFAAATYAFFTAGWNDGSTGPLLPVFQSTYNVSNF